MLGGSWVQSAVYLIFVFFSFNVIIILSIIIILFSPIFAFV